jgi:translation initiation factor 1A
LVKKDQKTQGEISEVQRVRLPDAEGGEQLGEVIQLLGHDKIKVKCSDGHVRICRIPGRMRKRTWIKNGDIVIIVPWDFQFENRADTVWRYTKGQVQWLAKKGYLDF